MAERSATFDTYHSASENPIGIETSERGWLQTWISGNHSASENPIGIETTLPIPSSMRSLHHSASENPIGIETGRASGTPRQRLRSQRIRKPDRD